MAHRIDIMAVKFLNELADQKFTHLEVGVLIEEMQRRLDLSKKECRAEREKRKTQKV